MSLGSKFLIKPLLTLMPLLGFIIHFRWAPLTWQEITKLSCKVVESKLIRSNLCQRVKTKYLTKWRLTNKIQIFRTNNRAIYNNSNNKFKKLLVVAGMVIQVLRILPKCIRMTLQLQFRTTASRCNRNLEIQRIGNFIQA